jgi:hypothetical protein
MDIIYFISGTILGATVHHIATRLGASTVTKGIEFITEPSPIADGQDTALEQLIDENSYNYDTYSDYIDGLEQIDDLDENDLLIIEDIPSGEKN